MKSLSLKISKGLPTIILLTLQLTACGGAADKYSATPAGTTAPNPQPPYIPPTSSIGAAVAACVAEPMRGTVYYYCDCGSGHDPSCVAGSDASTNPGTDPLHPRQTIGDAMKRFNSNASNVTVALCQGGAFDATSSGDGMASLYPNSTGCAPGTTCNDIREYAPPPSLFTSTAKPIINNAYDTNPNNKTGNKGLALFRFASNVGGVRFLNLKLQAHPIYPGQGFYFYRGAHDVTMCNTDMDAFSIAVYNESGTTADASTSNIKLTGSLITNSKAMGYLGGGDNDEISYNTWNGNGSDSAVDHTIYYSTVKKITNVKLIGNYVHGQNGTQCLGAPIVAHMAVDGLLVKDNIVDIVATENTGGCWGIAFNNFTSDTHAIYHRNAIFTGNTIRNGGNLALTVTGCPNCVIENNLIIHELIEATGIKVASGSARTGDDINTGNIIRNNTIWYGPNAANGGVGIEVGTEGTDHIIANNTVTYSAATTGGNGFSCFSYPLVLASYAFINNNHCSSAASSAWEATRGSLIAWKAAAPGFDTASFAGDPMFKVAGSDFTPATGSPLIATGSTTLNTSSAMDITGKARSNPPTVGAFEP